MEEIAAQLHGRGMVNAMKKAAGLVLRESRKNAPVNRGLLRSSLAMEVRATAREVQGVVGSPVKYAPHMEYGTKPFTPPLQPLVRWVELKFGKRGQDAILVAKGVQRKIARRGLKPRRYLRSAVEDNKSKLIDILEQGVKDIVNG